MDVPKRWVNMVLIVEECWLWKGQTDDKGYGQLEYNGKRMRAHRAFYKELVGDPPPMLHHTCEVRRCVNPAHLLPVTALEHSALHAGGRPGGLRGPGPLATNCGRGHDLSLVGFKERVPRVPRGWQLRCRVCRRASKNAWRARRQAAGFPRT